MKQKLLTLLCAVVIAFLHAFGQPAITRQYVAGGNSIDRLTSMDLTNDKGWILAGYSTSNISGDKTQNSRGNYDYWLVKYNRRGQIQWNKTIGGIAADYLSAVQQTKDCGYILGGHSLSGKSGEKTQNGRGAEDYWIVKLSRNGKVEWDKTIGGSDYDYLASVEQTTDGGYILGGSSISDISGEKIQNSKGSNDYWVVKTDNAGNIQWQRTIGGSGVDNVNAIHQTKDGGYIVCGVSNSNASGDKTENNKCNCTNRTYSYDYWIVKLNSKGQIQWDKTIGGGDISGFTGNDAYNDIQQTSDGGYIVGGISDSNASGDKTENSKGSYDYWIVKLDNKGNKQWDKTIGGSSLEGNEGLSIQQTKDGGYIMSAESWSNKSGDKTENNRCPGCGDVFGDPYFDYWLVKTDGLGNVQWDKTIGGLQNDVGVLVKELRQDVYIIAGSSESGIGADKTIASNGFYDYWTVKLKYTSPAVRIIASSNQKNIQLKESSKFSLYPNPVKDVLQIRNEGKSTTFTLTNQLGTVLLTQKINGSGSINISHIPSGIYFIKDNSTGVTQKIIVSK